MSAKFKSLSVWIRNYGGNERCRAQIGALARYQSSSREDVEMLGKRERVTAEIGYRQKYP